jgi:hypothetical protein
LTALCICGYGVFGGEARQCYRRVGAGIKRVEKVRCAFQDVGLGADGKGKLITIFLDKWQKNMGQGTGNQSREERMLSRVWNRNRVAFIAKAAGINSYFDTFSLRECSVYYAPVPYPISWFKPLVRTR